METLEAGKFRFGVYELDRSRRLLTRDGVPVEMKPKTFDLLSVLVKNHGIVLTKDELLDEVWPGQFVEENNLTVQISAIRKFFGERKGDNNFVATVTGRGYSFVQVVERVDVPVLLPNNPLVKNTESLVASNGNKADSSFDSDPVFGRSNEIEEIGNFLQSGVRLIILTGAGGSGKTRLAQAVAARSLVDFPDGAFFVELAAIQNPELVPTVIAQAIGIKEFGESDPIDHLVAELGSLRILLILDNFEQLIPAAPMIKEILGAAPMVKILVTSRIALRLKNEQEFVVLPLSVPPINSTLTNEQLSEFPSIRLFVARAQAVNHNFRLTPANVADVAEICRRLDGLPLAIELAAARVKLLSVQSILARLQRSLDLLSGGTMDLPERQRTIRSMIEWSYDLLDDDAKTLFQRVSVFSGGFSVEAAEAVGSLKRTSDDGLPPSSQEIGPIAESEPFTANILDLLTSLLDSNLLFSKEQPDGSFRLQMLEVVREFALEYLEESGESASVRLSHADFFLSLAEEAEPYLFSGQSIDWMNKLDAEHDNLRSALGWLLEHSPAKGARIAASLGQFWISRSYLIEARRWLEAAIQKNENDLSDTRFKLLNTFSLVARNQGDYAATRRASEQSLSASRAANNLPQIILSCHAVAALETREGNFVRARKLIKESLAISRELGDEKQVGFSLSFLSNLFLSTGDYSAARDLIEESLEISRRLGLTVNVSTNLTNLGTVAFYEDDTEGSFQYFAESLTICREMGNTILVSCCIDGLAAVAASRENMEQAALLAGAAESARQSVGYEIELTEHLFRESYIGKIRAVLDEKTFAACYEQGQALNIDSAISLIFKDRQLLGQPGENNRIMADLLWDEDTEVIIENHRIDRIIIEH